MKKFSYFILVFSFVLLVVSLFGLYFSNKSIQTEIFYASVYVSSDGAGFDLNKTALTFGKIQKPGTSSRYVKLVNKNSFPVEAVIDVKGDIKDLLEYENNIRIEPNETKKVILVVNAYSNTIDRFYSGDVVFKLIPLRV